MSQIVFAVKLSRPGLSPSSAQLVVVVVDIVVVNVVVVVVNVIVVALFIVTDHIIFN